MKALIVLWLLVLCLFSIPFWADGYDEELLRESAHQYVMEHGGDLYQVDTFRYVVVHEESVIRLEMMNIFNADTTSIERLEKL